MGVVRVSGNGLGFAFAGAGVLVGVAVGTIVEPALAAAIGAGTTLAADLAFRFASGDFEERGGHLYRIPVWIMGFAIGVASLGLFAVQHDHPSGSWSSSSSSPSHASSHQSLHDYLESGPANPPSAPDPMDPPSPRAVTSPSPLAEAEMLQKFLGFVDKLQAIATSTTIACDDKQRQITDLVDANADVIHSVYGSGAELPPAVQTRVADGMSRASDATHACGIDLAAIMLQ
jgi:hypothetical protein